LKLWTRHHRALLNALRAQDLVPKLVRRLSLERCAAAPDDTRLLRDWAASVQEDPGWTLIEAHVDQPHAWPAVWHRAVEAGWSSRSDHHHALIFAQFCDELVATQDLEVARYAWGECIEAWIRVFDSDYVDLLFEKLGATGEQTRRNLLVPLVDARVRDLREALGLDQAAAGERLLDGMDRRRTRFGWQALEAIEQAFANTNLEHNNVEHEALEGAREHAKDAFARIRRELLARFATLVDDLDLAGDGADAVSLPFEWIRQVFAILPIDATVAARVADATVNVGWKLRQLEVDKSDALMGRLLNLAGPFNDKLAGFIDSGEAFGHNATCADFFVFQGEHRDGRSEREAFFERALQACPSHRNASMMLSYEKLREVSDLLLRIRLMPAALRIVPGASNRVEAAVRDVTSLLDDAHELFPSNENISKYRDEILAEAERLGAQIRRDQSSGDQSSGDQSSGDQSSGDQSSEREHQSGSNERKSNKQEADE
jgi:hypothetical protein